MHYFVTGATGLLGSHVVEELVDDGHDVTGLTRSRSNAAHLPDEATIVEGDITHKESMREAGLYSDAETGVVDESYRPTPPPSVYLRTKWEAHYEVAKPMMDEGLPLVVVLPGNIFGRWDKPYGTTRGILRGYLEGELPMVPQEWAFPYEYAEDTARSHIRAMERGDPGEEYIIAGESMTLAELFDIAESISGVATPRTAPQGLFSVFASGMGLVERVATPPEGFEPETLEFLSGNSVRVDNSKAKRELGIEHRPVADGLRRYFEWEQSQS